MDYIFNQKNEIKEQYRRGILTPISATLSKVGATLVILGTALSLLEADHAYSAISKPELLVRIVQFPTCDISQVEEVLRSLLNLDNCHLDKAMLTHLTGRPRFCVRTIQYFISTGDQSQESKQSVFNKALQYAISSASIGLEERVSLLLGNDPHGSNALLLSRLVLAWELNGGKMTFVRDSESDFVNKALCALHAARGNKYGWGHG
ncbi:hypothetical protein HK096_004624 [Nowakowskiella sp. JEL0078]|nr:hypothetical protein HK096_004624 [Nowakowskiella sp. JEL0078]